MISVVVVSHQSQRELPDCLARLRGAGAEVGFGSDGDSLAEVLVVDSGSSDRGPELVERDHPEVRLVRSGNLGFGAACNLGARLGRGSSILFLNADALLTPGALRELHVALEADARLGLVAPRLSYPDGRRQFDWMPPTGVLGEALQKLRNPFESARWNHAWLPRGARLLLGPGWYTGACLLVRRAAFEEIGGFDERYFLYFEDSDLCLRLRAAGWRLAQASGAEVLHVKGASAHAGVPLAYRQSQWRFYQQHRPAWERAVLRRRLRRQLAREDWPWRA